LLCIFPFEESFFRGHNVAATFIGHPLSDRAKTTLGREEFLQKIGLHGRNPVVALLPGSRVGEAARHCETLREAVGLLRRRRPLDFVLAASPTIPASFFSERLGDLGVQVVEGETANVLGHADVALVASGTATVEAALLGTPMVVFYKVTVATWWVGRLLVRVPFYSMVNLLAQEQIVPELIQHQCTGERLAEEALRLLDDDALRHRTRERLAAVAAGLQGPVPAAQRAAEVICDHLQIRGWSNVSAKPLTVS
jgi:lipid-A-disaccharide synthase